MLVLKMGKASTTENLMCVAFLLSKNLLQRNKAGCFFLTLRTDCSLLSNYGKRITSDLYLLWQPNLAFCVCVCVVRESSVSRLDYKISSKPLTPIRTLNNWEAYGQWHLWKSRKIDVYWWGCISDHSSWLLSVVELTLPAWCQVLQWLLPDGPMMMVSSLLCPW